MKFLTWTDDNLLRQVIYAGLREDKPAVEVHREAPHPRHAGKAFCAALVRSAFAEKQNAPQSGGALPVVGR